MLPTIVYAAKPVELDENTYKADLGTIITQIKRINRITGYR
jgi:hypothetical protein